jgi:hypothetical protein
MPTLHNATLFLGAFALACGLGALAMGFGAGFVFAFWGAMIVLGIVCEKVIYKPIEDSVPAGNWVRTTERFLDEKGRPVTVWQDPQTGERRYIHG